MAWDNGLLVPLDLRFWTKVHIKKSNQCWDWLAYKNCHGYGILTEKGRCIKAHRIAYNLTFGKIPKNLLVCHKCDNRSCVNPKHLFLGSNAENMKDMSKKGRSRNMAGENNPRKKLSKTQVLLIRREFILRKNCNLLAKRFKVEPTTIYHIATRRSWKSVK